MDLLGEVTCLTILFLCQDQVPLLLTDLSTDEEHRGHIRGRMIGKSVCSFQKALCFLVISTHHEKRCRRANKRDDLSFIGFARYSPIQSIKDERDLLFEKLIV